MKIQKEIKELCDAFLKNLVAILGNNLHGVYLYGAVAFPDTTSVRDIDFHVIIKHPLNDSEKTQLKNLHIALAMEYPPLGAELDGYYILLQDVRNSVPPGDQLRDNIKDNSYALHCEHLRSEHRIILYGPEPERIYPKPSWMDVSNALEEEFDYVKKHLDDYPDYCVLNLCRLMYSYETQDVVVSKRASGRWAKVKYSQWEHIIEAAIKSYDNQATKEDLELLKSEIHNFLDFASEHINSMK